LDHLSLLPLVTSKFKVLAPLDWFHGDVLFLILAVGGLHFQNDLLCGLGLLVEDRLGLTTITGLFPVITPTTLAKWRLFAFFVLGDLVGLMGPGSRAIGFSCFRDVDHFFLKKSLQNL